MKHMDNPLSPRSTATAPHINTATSHIATPPLDSSPRTVAAIDIGATSIRMAIAEILHDGSVRTLESLLQPVDLGRDAFETRRLSRKGIERAAAVLRRFRRVLREYGIDSTNDIRVVATSAVREASNRVAFIDRVYVATGLDVEPIDEAEVNRITYMGITPQLMALAETAESKSLVVEVGGGSTELLVIRGGNVLHSESFRLGSLRLLQTLDASGARGVRWRELLETHIRRILVRIGDQVRTDTQLHLVAIGGDIRFAAHRLIEDWDETNLARVPVDKLEELTQQILEMGEDAVVKKFGATFVEAETLAPALLAYTMLARHFDLKHILVSDINLRDGLLCRVATGPANFVSKSFARRCHSDANTKSTRSIRGPSRNWLAVCLKSSPKNISWTLATKCCCTCRHCCTKSVCTSACTATTNTLTTSSETANCLGCLSKS